MTVRDQEAALAEADELRYELDMYKSVALPTEHKPRTGITRVGRQPLVNQTLNVKPSSAASIGKSASAAKSSGNPVGEYSPGDMTIDELL
jgi:hypothetical protein